METSKEYQICTRCIMDTTDPDIVFNSDGVCNHCLEYDNTSELYGYKGKESDEILNQMISNIQYECKDDKYDCLVGLSGGVDSSYIMHLASSFGLRILALHIDAGWNTQVAESNIEKMVNQIDCDFHNIEVDWQTMKELQRAFMFSGMPNLDIPQDHAFLAMVNKFAKENNIKYIFNGSNIATESILPSAWAYDNKDAWLMKSVYKKWGRGIINLKKYPFINVKDLIRMATQARTIHPLNMVDYSRKGAIEKLNSLYGWESYGDKHFESHFTRFFQGYLMPMRFGFDKKRAHLSSIVVAGEITREEALNKLVSDNYANSQTMLEDKKILSERLDLSEKDWENIIYAPILTEDDYRNQKALRSLLSAGYKVVKPFVKKR